LADEIFVQGLQTIPDVASVDIWGDKTYAMRLWIDPQKLAAYRLTPLDVRRAIQRENVELPAGRIEGGTVELPVRMQSRLTTPEEFNDLILKEDAGGLVRFRDVGRAELGPQNDRTVLKKDGVPMVAVVLRPQPGANYIEIADEFYKRVEQIRRELPPGVTVDYGFDTTQFIRDSIKEVVQTIFMALVLVILIIYAFLRDTRTTLIPLVVIPVSLVGAFFLMYLAGFTVNVLTLLALVLAIGIVVDDAIVVLENIYVKIEAGQKPLQAGVLGTREIFFAVIATTVALVAVLMPVMFLSGLTGRLFREFGATLAGAVIISSFVALTLTPMLCTRILRSHGKHSGFHRATEPFFRAMAETYRDGLGWMMARRWVAIPLLVICAGLIALFVHLLPSELAPLEDRGSLRISAKGPEGATFSYMDSFMDDMGKLVAKEVPEARQVVWVTSPGHGASSSVNSGFMRVRLKNPDERSRSQEEIADALGASLEALPGADTYVTQDPTIAVGRRHGLPVQFVLQAATLDKLKDVLPRFMDEARKEPAFSTVDVDLVFDKPELHVQVDRARARDLGVTVLDVAQTVQLALSEQRLGFFVMDGKQYEIIGQVTSPHRNDTADLRNFYVTARNGDPVLLDNLVNVTEESSPPQLYRFDRYASATVSAGLAPGYTISQGIDAMKAIASRLLDDSYHTALAGQSRDFEESSNTLAFVFVLAVVLLYLVLAAQFESFRDPFTIMLTVPLALAGALFSLWWFHQTLNIFSQIGMIMLIGLVTKNGILIVEFANQRRAAGRTIHEAVVEAAVMRLRPVLMTSLSTILGIVPIALALGAGSESRVPMGIAVIGGLTLGTFLTLFVVPAMYSYLTSRTVGGVRIDDIESTQAA
ncbi:MAG TPA: efflux RND transporter permease subunit, partial [Candidatus Saccharimonadales bacterium]|nr:efflux RND transporter permease subunit [Candidatus Saccharimonadales bacterium]